MPLSKINRPGLNTGVTDNSDATAITIDSSERVGIGAAPAAKLHVQTSAVNSSIDNVADEFVIENNGASGMTILSANNDSGFILFGDPDYNAAAGIRYEHANSAMSFRVNSGWDKLRIDSSGRVTMPNQPLARASYSGGNLGATAILPLNSNTYTRGGMTVANNRITVPVTGAYFVGYHHLANLGGVQIRVKINGSGVAGSQTQEMGGSNTNFSAQQIISLAANDYLEFETFSGGTVHGNSSYNCMYAYLLG